MAELLLPERWFELPQVVLNHPVQRRLFHESTTQFKVVAAGRRSFKTERMKRRFVDLACFQKERGKRKSYFLGAPTRPQAKMIFWEDIKALSPKWAIKGKPKESELTLEYQTGNKIVIVGLEEYERVEGIRWDGCGITEYQKVDPLFFGKTLQPILNDSGGECILEGRPLGKNHFYDDFNRMKTDPERWESFTWTSEEILSAGQIIAAKQDLGEEDYRREYLADFEVGGQRTYYAYNQLNHKVHKLLEELPVIVTCDFNATEKPMSWTVGQRVGNVTYWVKSLSYTFTNTLTMCEILDKYLSTLLVYPKYLNLYGDYSGMKQTTNSSLSDWQIIENYFRNKEGSKPIIEKKLKPTTSVRDRVAATNAQLCNTLNERRMFVDPQECKPLIRDWDRVTWKSNGVDLNDDDDRDTHNSDSVDYYSNYEFPIRNQARGYHF